MASQNLRNPQDKEEEGRGEKKKSFSLGPRVVSMLSLPQGWRGLISGGGERQSDGIVSYEALESLQTSFSAMLVSQQLCKRDT